MDFMMSVQEKEQFQSKVYRDAALSRILGIIEAYVKGKSVSLNWVHGQIVKGHNLFDARKVLETFADHLMSINSQKYFEVKERLLD